MCKKMAVRKALSISRTKSELLKIVEVTVGITSELHVRVNESAGFVKICVEADHESQTTYEVVFTTVEGTATGNSP